MTRVSIAVWLLPCSAFVVSGAEGAPPSLSAPRGTTLHVVVQF